MYCIFYIFFQAENMSRKTDRLAKKAAKKDNTPTVEKVEALNESSDEEIPEAVAINEEEVEEDSDLEEEEDDLEEDEEDDEEVALEKKAPRARINDEVKLDLVHKIDSRSQPLFFFFICVGCHDSYYRSVQVEGFTLD